MRRGIIVRSSTKFTWAFEGLLLLLPDPGTPQFATLCRPLIPFGLSASNITADKPTNELSDDFLSISLFDGRVTLDLSYQELVLETESLSPDEDAKLPDIIQRVFDALEAVRAEPNTGKVESVWNARLLFSQSEAEEILKEHSSEKALRPELDYLGFVYNIRVADQMDAVEPAIYVFRSADVPNGLDVQFSAAYEISEPSHVRDRLREDAQRALSLLGIEPQEVEGEN